MERPQVLRLALLKVTTLVFLASLFLPTSSLADSQPAPRPFSANYELELAGIKAGEIRLTLDQLGDGRYRYRRTSHTTGLVDLLRSRSIDEYSELEIINGELRPVHYFYLKQGRDTRRVSIDFDWESMTATNHVNDSRWTMAIPKGTWDKLSVELAVVLDLQVTGELGEYPVADGGQLKQYQFEQLGTEWVATDAGRFETLVIKRHREADSKRSTILWMAPTLHYVAAKVRHENKGEGEGEATLTSFQQQD
ncbi:MAG: DUF3108 domain-containing protein [Gammaproteobacteria bacterium]